MSTIVTRTAVSGAAPAGRSDDFDTLAPSPKALMRKRAKGHVGLIIGTTIIAVIVLMAVFAPLIAPYDPYAQDLSRRLIDPVWGAKGSWDNIFGTDALGRDVLSRLIYGARISLLVGFTAAVIAGIIGTALGILGGYYGGKVDAFVVYLINVKLALPVILVALSVSSISGGSIMALIILLGFLTWDRYAVVTRSMTQQMREREFIMSSKAAGASNSRILWREILPNLMNQVIIIASLDLYLKRPERQTTESDAKPSYTEINDELMSQVLARCGKGDRYIILAHNDGKIYDEMDLLLLDGLAEDFRFSRDEVVIYVYIDGTVSESLHALHFSGLV